MNAMPLIAGPCVIEDEGFTLEVATELKRQLAGLDVDWSFKASFDKANRTSISGFRGPGLDAGLNIFEKVKASLSLKTLTDVHDVSQCVRVAEVCDSLQIPAFLCRQTDLVIAASDAALARGRKLNIKKGQFLAPWDAKNIVDKVRAVEEKSSKKGAPGWLTITERGVSFGYNTLVVDMSSFKTIQKFGVPVIYDATHSIQVPGLGSGGTSTGGKRENLEVLARAAIAAGADGIFMEVHPDPARAKSDGPNALPLEFAGAFVKQLLKLRALVAHEPLLCGQ